MKNTSLALFLLVVLFLALFLMPVPAESSNGTTIFIRANGEVEGTDKIQRNGDVYTLTGDLSGSSKLIGSFIEIQKDDIVLDGAGKTVQGTGTGISLYGRNGVTVKNLKIIDFGVGISFESISSTDKTTPSSGSTRTQILNNEIKTTYWGINAWTNDSVISGNTIISPNPKYGVAFYSNNTIFSNNQFVGGGLVIDWDLVGNTFSNNTVNGKPLVYLEGASNQVVDGAGQVYLVNCRDMVVKNVNPSTNLRVVVKLSGTTNSEITSCGGRILLKNSHDNLVRENQATGAMSAALIGSSVIELSDSNNNTIAKNTITDIDIIGIGLSGSSYNDVYGNVIITVGQVFTTPGGNSYEGNAPGISLEGTHSAETFNTRFNSIHENNLTNCQTGISLNIAKTNAIYKNNIFGSKQAISLRSAHETSIIGNNIANSSEVGVSLYTSDDNIFHHNNFINNAKQASEEHFVYGVPLSYFYAKNNTWDDGREGNYWSNYTGTDLFGDGIGDTPHTVFENYTDYHPLMNPINIYTMTLNLQSSASVQESLQTTFILIVLGAAIAVAGVGSWLYFKRRNRERNPLRQ